MLDINIIRNNPQRVKKSCADKQVKDCNQIVDKLLEIDKKRRDLIIDIEDLRKRRNELSASSKSAKPKPGDIQEGKNIKKQLKVLEFQLKKIEKEFNNLLAVLPNLPAEDVPEGKDESENALVRREGKIPKFSFKPKDHLQLGEDLDLIDVKRAVKVSGSRFGYFKNEAVLLEFALIQYGFELLLKEGFTPVIPPELTRVPVFHKLGC